MNMRLCISRGGLENGAMLCSLFFNNWDILACVLLSAKVMGMLIQADQFLSINSGDKQRKA
jgi:hypothetical protein